MGKPKRENLCRLQTDVDNTCLCQWVLWIFFSCPLPNTLIARRQVLLQRDQQSEICAIKNFIFEIYLACFSQNVEFLGHVCMPRVAVFDHNFFFLAYTTFRKFWADIYDFRTAIA